MRRSHCHYPGFGNGERVSEGTKGHGYFVFEFDGGVIGSFGCARGTGGGDGAAVGAVEGGIDPPQQKCHEMVEIPPARSVHQLFDVQRTRIVAV